MANVLITPRADLAVRKEFDRFQPRVERAWTLFAKRLWASINKTKLEKALRTGDARKVMKLFPDELFDELLNPLSNILKDALIRGGRIGEREVE